MLDCVIVEDEPAAANILAGYIAEHGALRHRGTAHNTAAAESLIENRAPGLVFLDVRLGSRSGLDVLRNLRRQPNVIFTTAYDQYAVTAFELGAADYLLKPFGKERFDQAVARALAANARSSGARSVAERMKAAKDRDQKLTRLYVRDGNRIIPLPTGRISHFIMRDDYVAACLDGREYLLRVSLTDLESRLDADQFLRISRACVVNLDHVAEFRALPDRRLEAVLPGGQGFTVSRARSRVVRSRMTK